MESIWKAKKTINCCIRCGGFLSFPKTVAVLIPDSWIFLSESIDTEHKNDEQTVPRKWLQCTEESETSEHPRTQIILVDLHDVMEV